MHSVSPTYTRIYVRVRNSLYKEKSKQHCQQCQDTLTLIEGLEQLEGVGVHSVVNAVDSEVPCCSVSSLQV